MAALITLADSIPISLTDPDSSEQTLPETATCHCCGLIEECTQEYIAAVSKKYNGRWICGLCSEAVNVEICRLKTMAALITLADSVPISLTDPDSSEQTLLETATCHCCGLIEECTLAYIAAVSKRYNGRWICGLCSEAVNDEICQLKSLISTEEAVNRHVSFCRKFRVSGAPPAVDTAEHFIAVVRQIVRRSLDLPRAVRSPPLSRFGGS